MTQANTGIDPANINLAGAMMKIGVFANKGLNEDLVRILDEGAKLDADFRKVTKQFEKANAPLGWGYV